MNIRYSSGIFCKKPLRSLKIYTYGISQANASNMTLEVYRGVNLVTSFKVKFHQIGFDIPGGVKTQPKQGYAVPVIADPSYEYRLSMANDGVLKYPNGNLPPDWVIEFSDSVIGNRWKPDEIVLTVKGQGCNKKLVNSQHDRRFLWSQTENYPNPKAWGRGACSSGYPDMPAVTCPAVPPPVKALSCDGECATSCQNGFCECGSKQCVCNAGYYGPDCSANICDASRCGAHGKCIATYLGGELLPSQGTCVCDQGWSGPTCDQHVCEDVTCSGRGYCQAKGDTDHKCICDSPFTGSNCELVKQDHCTMCPTNFLTACGSGDSLDRTMSVCNAGTGSVVGCYYSKTYFDISPGACCFSNCGKCDLIDCPPATNDCHLSAACNPLDGACGVQTPREDGSPCHSIPFGTCLQGVCQPTALTPNNQTYAIETLAPSIAPSTIMPTYTSIPTEAPTFKPTLLAQYQYLGCFGDTVNRAMELKLKKVNSTVDCYDYAYFAGYKYYALQFGRECWVSNNYTMSTMYGHCGKCTNCGNPECSCAKMKCVSGENCGDMWANALYMITPSGISLSAPSETPTADPTIAPIVSYTPTYSPTYAPTRKVEYEYLGCYGDYIVRSMETTLGNVNSVLECYKLALSNGYSLYGLQYGNECRVSNNYTMSTIYGQCGTCTKCANTKCNCANKKCASGENCGDGWASALYRIPSISNSTNSALPSLTPSSSRPPTLSPIYAPYIVRPSATPSVIPSLCPSIKPTEKPSAFPSANPTSVKPTGQPSSFPSMTPTYVPSLEPTGQPSSFPSMTPTYVPSLEPTGLPLSFPSVTPTYIPSSQPTGRPSNLPSRIPSSTPTFVTTEVSTRTPSSSPSSSVTPTFKPTLKTSYKYLGCYGDFWNRALPVSVGNVNSILDCYKLAAAGGYSVYGLQYGGQCWLGNNLTIATMYGQCGKCTTCGNPACNCANTKCPNGEDCGDGWANALYQVTYRKTRSVAPSLSPITIYRARSIPSAAPPCNSYNYSYVGCFNDNNPRAMEQRFLNAIYDPQSCYIEAKRAGFAYFSLQYGGECWASNKFVDVVQYGPSNMCTMPCINAAPVNEDDDIPIRNCGGSMANAVYAVNPGCTTDKRI